MPSYAFGTGDLYLARTDVANSTPVKVGTLQDVSVDLSADTVQLFGGNQFAELVQRGQAKVDVKVSTGRVQGRLLSDLYFGETMSTGNTTVSVSEAGAVPASSPYEITVTNEATFVDDLGVINASTGNPLTRVASSPTTGQYSVSAGVYTFAAADDGLGVLISYSYSIASTGQHFTVTNHPLGYNPVFAMTLRSGATTSTGQTTQYMHLYSCVASKLSFPFKQKDFLIEDFEFSAFANAAGKVLDFGMSEAS